MLLAQSHFQFLHIPEQRVHQWVGGATTRFVDASDVVRTCTGMRSPRQGSSDPDAVFCHDGDSILDREACQHLQVLPDEGQYRSTAH